MAEAKLVRLRNTRTGDVVQTRESNVAGLPYGLFEPAKAESKPAPKKAAAKSDDK